MIWGCFFFYMTSFLKVKLMIWSYRSRSHGSVVALSSLFVSVARTKQKLISTFFFASLSKWVFPVILIKTLHIHWANSMGFVHETRFGLDFKWSLHKIQDPLIYQFKSPTLITVINGIRSSLVGWNEWIGCSSDVFELYCKSRSTSIKPQSGHEKIIEGQRLDSEFSGAVESK